MNRSLAAILAFSAVSLMTSTQEAYSWPGSDGARGMAVLRFHGGTVHPDPDPGAGPGWLAGAAVGVGVSRNLLLLTSYDHIYIDQPGSNHLTMDPVTVQLELGRPFHSRISPRLSLGAGVYVRSREPLPYIVPMDPVLDGGTSFPEYGRRTDSPFGMNMGGGLSFLLSRRVMLDLGARYHQTMGSHDVWVLTTATAGLTIGLSRELEGDDGYIDRGEVVGTVLTRR